MAEKKKKPKKQEKASKDLSDEELIVFTREKDKSAYSFIINRYDKKIWRYIKRLTNNPGETDDLVQQTFINVFVNIHSFDKNKKFSSWIYGIAHNLAVNYIKKKKAKISLDYDKAIADSLFSKEDIMKEVFRKELKEDINALLDKLPEKFKAPIILKFMEEKTYEEISDILRIPKNTVGTMINRAKVILKKELEKKYGKQ